MGPNIITGRVISKGAVSGEALLSKESISFSGGVDLEGVVVENQHPLKGENLAGKILVFPALKGSAAGMWMLYRLALKGKAPIGLIVREADAILTAAAIFGEIPTMDHFDQDPLSCIKTGDTVRLDSLEGTVTIGYNFINKGG
jgi:predicted aconitase with swiveling domain